MPNEKILGKITDGTFQPFSSGLQSCLLTRLQPYESRPPDSEQIDLAEYEGKVILVEGSDQGGWIYSAIIVEAASPILSMVAERLFGADA